ncbi:histidine phosphatase family protein [Halalkalibacterium halodurans]|nr:histidine phosphatase family protein [Halalkalibacterium halodurans]MDY7220792.1 histidine phosphatase family protein [Halalkalibacterium halodurans]MDY7240031.1 histidine phosphatase family protein [Halalkalibacterium halodurans]
MFQLKSIYVIRHCEAEGQPPESPLTNKGLKQAIDLAAFFDNIKVERIISSPYKRAIQTIQPLAKKLNVEIEINSQLTERVLSTNHLSDWFEKLRTTFEDFEIKFEGGESSQDAVKRILNVVEDSFTGEFENTLIVTHGNLMSLLLNHYNKEFGFDEWLNLSNPDVYLLKIDNNEITSERLWS